MKEFKLYLRCMLKNIFCLVGFLLIIASLVLPFFIHADMLEKILVSYGVFSLGFMSSGLTKFGEETYDAYLRTKKHIQKWGVVDKRFIYTYYTCYCQRVGIKMAAKETGIKIFLKKTI